MPIPLARVEELPAAVPPSGSAASRMRRTASGLRRPRHGALGDPTTLMTVASFSSCDVKKALLSGLTRGDRLDGERLAEPRARHEPADARRGGELAVLDEDVAAQEDELGRADDLRPLVERVVALRVVGRRGDRLPPLGVEDDEVGVGADGDRPLARVQAEQLRRLRGEEVDHAVEGDASFADAEVVDHLEAILEPGPAVRDLREVVL